MSRLSQTRSSGSQAEPLTNLEASYCCSESPMQSRCSGPCPGLFAPKAGFRRPIFLNDPQGSL